ncbi:hypothetical protein SD70_16420 [Gordoniibacillus kamchatkensis]|uniref:Uncharacterized protein n=1 Tax=Gordoniibacillus kamchatkensis TaxID=1590651 RepID=A0ABR5AHY6_9BACL|nr:DL-endopeptidase inhibitor IseA family protein [Paenibacillus sp. VKM B-2647]KIL39972.1 hypothetical protein SD70_16420 [Paenibacillus sp. VKM B-2647]
MWIVVSSVVFSGVAYAAPDVVKLIVDGKADSFWKHQLETKALIDIDGKLAQPNADGGRVARWRDAKITLEQYAGTWRRYEAVVPMGDKSGQKADIKLRYVRGEGWRVDEAVGTIR